LAVAVQHHAGARVGWLLGHLAWHHQGLAGLLLAGVMQPCLVVPRMPPLLIMLVLQPSLPVLLPGAVAVAVPRVQLHTEPILAAVAARVHAVPPGGHSFVGRPYRSGCQRPGLLRACARRAGGA
jgi:hypothetical protein